MFTEFTTSLLSTPSSESVVTLMVCRRCVFGSAEHVYLRGGSGFLVFEVLGVKVTHEGCQRLLDRGSACTGQPGLGFATRYSCILHIYVFFII